MRETYEYSPGPSVFMSGESDWNIRRVGKPGIIANVVGHESAAKAAVDALNQADRRAERVTNALRAYTDQLAAALHVALHVAHPTYGSTAGRRGGIGGQVVTTGCSLTDPPPEHQWMANGALSEPLRDYLTAWGADLRQAVQDLTERLSHEHDPTRTTTQED